MSRGDVFQKAPAAGQDLTNFPTVTPSPRRRWRAHAAEFGPWWFSVEGSGRFDLPDTGATADGTCYFADTVRTAVRESSGDRIQATQAVTHALASAIKVSSIVPPQPRTYAAVTSDTADGHGVTRELTTMTDYTVTQAWSEAFHAFGLDGVRYSSRYTSAPGPNSWALFGPRGEDATLEIKIDREKDGVTACEQAGLTVIAPPGPKKGFTIL